MFNLIIIKLINIILKSTNLICLIWFESKHKYKEINLIIFDKSNNLILLI